LGTPCRFIMTGSVPTLRSNDLIGRAPQPLVMCCCGRVSHRYLFCAPSAQIRIVSYATLTIVHRSWSSNDFHELGIVG